jgi:hypothetical protein
MQLVERGRQWPGPRPFWLAAVQGRDMVVIAHRFVLYPVSSC